MNDFKIGDKVKLKKISEEEFEEIYYKKHNCFPSWSYKDHLYFYNKYFDNIFEINGIDKDRIFCKNCISWFYEEEIEKVNHIKTKFKIVNKLLNKNLN